MGGIYILHNGGFLHADSTDVSAKKFEIGVFYCHHYYELC
jgi:hypothetical protein